LQPFSSWANSPLIFLLMRRSILLAATFVVGLAGLSLSSCRKTEVEEIVNLGYLPPFTLPDSLALTYGQKIQLDLPAEYQNLPDVTLTLSFKDNAKVKVNATDSLTNLVARAVTVDQATRKVSIDASQLYPTTTTSSVNGVRTPRNYLATLTATSSTGFKQVQSRLKIKVLPAQLNLVEVPSTDIIPYAYGIYDNKPLAYTVDYAGLNAANTQLVLEVNGRPDGKVNIAGRQVVVAAGAGDPDQKYEWTYDLLPTLTKDGYRVAYRQFRVVLMPKPKFFFGTYYSDYNLTVLENRLVLQLGKAYTSKAPTFYPSKYQGTYTLKSIEKDGAPFVDTAKLFSVDATTGKISVLANIGLPAGEYKVTLQTHATTGLTLETALTLVMEL
jgi:hypothetical protein